MSIKLGNIPVEFIEYRPGEGLVFRTAQDIGSDFVQDEAHDIEADLTRALRGSPYFVYRICCDSAALKNTGHADDCPKEGKAK